MLPDLTRTSFDDQSVMYRVIIHYVFSSGLRPNEKDYNHIWQSSHAKLLSLQPSMGKPVTRRGVIKTKIVTPWISPPLLSSPHWACSLH